MRFIACRCATIAMLAMVSPATAASERDWNDCKASDPDISIGGCTKVLEEEEEAAQNRRYAYSNRDRRYAYSNRGNAWYAKGDFDRAIADNNEAIWLAPLNLIGHSNRGAAWFAKGNLERAMLDYNEAIRLSPKSPNSSELQPVVTTHMRRGIASLYNEHVPEALTDFKKASELAPKSPYAALWLDIVNKRSNRSPILPQAMPRLDMTKWPAPVIRLFLGQMTPEAVLAAADDPSARTRQGQVCEANFYTGELALQGGAKEQAANLFRLATADCPKLFLEWSAASAQLRALGLTP
jgi:tetratricopeptide (TPR) repeat protein